MGGHTAAWKNMVQALIMNKISKMGKFNMNPLWFGPFMDRLLYISWNITFKKYEMAQISIYLNIKILKIILFESFFFFLRRPGKGNES